MSGNSSLLDDVYLWPAVESVADAIERMEAITTYIDSTDPRGERDGLASFNFLYTTITKRVQEGIDTGFFEDNEFLTQLDIDFANRYFNALRASIIEPPRTPRVWKILLDRRSDDRVEPIQFAVAGVNAHVNFDLAFAVLETCDALEREPTFGTQRSDYEKVNQIFAEEMEFLRQHFLDDVAREIDGLAAPVLNILSNWSVDAARDAAWEVAQHIWTLKQFGIKQEAFIDRIDRFATLAGNFLLTPVRE